MKRFLASLCMVLTVFSGFTMFTTASASAEARYKKFCEYKLSPPVLKPRIIASLNKDPSGNARVEGCWARAIDFFQAWEEEETGMQSVRDLPAFLDSLVEMTPEVGLKYSSSCIRTDGNGHIKRCVERQFHAGEKAYGKNGEIFLMGDCVNPVHATVSAVVVTGDPCIRVEFPTQQGQDVRLTGVDQQAWGDRCLRLVRAGGNPDGERGLPTECPDSYVKVVDGRDRRVSCSWDDVESVASELLGFQAETNDVSGSFKARAAGTNVLYLPAKAKDGLLAICWEMPDGSFRTLGVRRAHYQGNVATITQEHVNNAQWVR